MPYYCVLWTLGVISKHIRPKPASSRILRASGTPYGGKLLAPESQRLLAGFCSRFRLQAIYIHT